MNRKLILKVIGLILCIEALCMLPSLILSVITRGTDLLAFLIPAVLCAAIGLPLRQIRAESTRFRTRDGYACVALCWVVLSLFGALPYSISGAAPTYADAIFETVSGFTTTGASVMTAPEALPYGILFWRALTQWMGGMGILVLVLALLPKIGEGSMNLMRAESPGPISSKLLPKTTATAKILYAIYIGLTAAEALLLRIAGMPWFDSITTSFTTISTGGFSVRNASIAAYNSEAILWIVTVFMFLSAINFSLLFFAIRGRFREMLRSEELQVYTAVVLIASALITLSLILQAGETPYFSLSRSIFYVVSLISTTGYATVDYTLWPAFAQLVLLLVMFCGGCAGSTSGGLKVSRVVLLFKSLRREIQRLLHPREVRTIRLDGQRVEEETISGVSVFFFAYFGILLFTAAAVSLDGVSFGTAFSAALTSISNVGPGIEQIGPVLNFAFLSPLNKIVLSFTMLLGRLEILPILLLLSPRLWYKPRG